jgi:hypothetical protein
VNHSATQALRAKPTLTLCSASVGIDPLLPFVSELIARSTLPDSQADWVLLDPSQGPLAEETTFA